MQAYFNRVETNRVDLKCRNYQRDTRVLLKFHQRAEKLSFHRKIASRLVPRWIRLLPDDISSRKYYCNLRVIIHTMPTIRPRVCVSFPCLFSIRPFSNTHRVTAVTRPFQQRNEQTRRKVHAFPQTSSRNAQSISTWMTVEHPRSRSPVIS